MPFDALESADGIELWSWVTDTAERLSSVRSIVRFVTTPQRVVDHPPPENLAAWDRMCAARRVPAIGGIDAHQIGKRIAGRVPLKLMSYKRSFRHLRTHVLCDELSEAAVLRRAARGPLLPGDRLARAREGVPLLRGGSRRHRSDGRRDGRRPVRHPREPPAAGSSAAAARRLGHHAGRGSRLAHRVAEPGVYRVEATLDAHGAERTWILSNPIYLRGG